LKKQEKSQERWKDGRMERWKSGMLEEWNVGTPIAIGGNVEALAEIPLRREKNGRVEKWNVGRMEDWKEGKMEDWNVGWIKNCQLPTYALRLMPPDLPTANCQLPTSDF
jgi:hypothetical protein